MFRYEGHTSVVRNEPGVSEARHEQRPVNVGCFLGDSADVIFIANARDDIAWLLAQLDKEHTRSGQPPGVTNGEKNDGQ